jgi:hypothetical protein
MTERDKVLAALAADSILAGFQWAWHATVRRTLETYNEADGHDAALLGSLRFTVLRDRFDRVFSCERYATAPGAVTGDLDPVYDQLSAQDISDMPRIALGAVTRADLNGSPGWCHQNRRFLLASGAYGKLEKLPWPQKGPTKQNVAMQPNPEQLQGSLFPDLAPEEIGGLQAAVGVDLDLPTFVVAHSLDPIHQQGEFLLGRPRLNAGGGKAWHWTASLLSPITPHKEQSVSPISEASARPEVGDAPVRRRPSKRREGEGHLTANP